MKYFEELKKSMTWLGQQENTLFYSKTKLNIDIFYSKKNEKIEKCNKTKLKSTYQKIKKTNKLLYNNSKIT